MNIIKSTRQYEEWLARQLKIVQPDLQIKHQRMQASLFEFFRATFYRWAQLWPEICKPLNDAPKATAVGDLHVENFGTWRDAEGRLVWGINDFDEAFRYPYTYDLTRLLTSVLLARSEEHLQIDVKEIAATVLDGYRASMKCAGKALVLSDEQTPLREMAIHRLKEPGHFWARLESQHRVNQPPREVKKMLKAALPKKSERVVYAHRIAGLGSLGHERYIAIAIDHGGRIARETKARCPSACVWAGARREKDGYRQILKNAVRCPDPTIELTDHWLIRRLSPDCSRIELADLPHQRDERALLWSMGWETANIHLGDGDRSEILKDLAKRSIASVTQSAIQMRDALESDWQRWRA
jgi:uncharacterized protein (DUF2252 family)